MIVRTVAALGLALLVGCGQSATPEKNPAGGQADASGTVDPNATLVVFNVPGMTRPMKCTARAKEALDLLPGVTVQSIDFPNRTVTCMVNTSKSKTEDAVKALVAVDFPKAAVKN